MRKNISKTTLDIIYFIIGAAVYSIAVNVFLSPSGISPGGFTGIAAVLNHITSLPTGITLFALNIPVLILGYVKMGGLFIIKTAVATALTSFGIDITAKIIPPLKTDAILSSVFGGILMGVGLSLTMLRGATTGGVDIIGKLVNRKYPHLSVGKIILMADGAVIFLNALVYKNAQSALYSVVAIYASTRMMDTLLYGADRGKIIYIVTDKADYICREINGTLGRGVTKLSVVGGYTGEARTMLMCIVRAHEAAAVHDAVRQYDNRAFIVVTDAGEIIGEGFKPQY